MARDPVCGMHVDEDHAIWTAEIEGKTYYFCSEQCMLTFVQPGSIDRYNILTIPTIIIFQDGEVKEKLISVPRREEILEALGRKGLIDR